MKIFENLTVSATFIAVTSTWVENVLTALYVLQTFNAKYQQQIYIIITIYIFTNAQPLGSNAGLLHNVIIYKRPEYIFTTALPLGQHHGLNNILRVLFLTSYFKYLAPQGLFISSHPSLTKQLNPLLPSGLVWKITVSQTCD